MARYKVTIKHYQNQSLYLKVIGIINGRINLRVQFMPKISRAMTFKEVSAIKKVGTTAIGGAAGLYLQVNPNGQRYYVYRYKAKDGQRSFISLGNFKTLSLTDARKQAEEWREMVRKGENPAHVKKIRQMGAKAQADAFREYIEKAKRTFFVEAEAWLRERADSGYWDNNERAEGVHRGWLKNHVLPHIGHIEIDKLTSRDVFKMILPIWQTSNNTARSCLRCVRNVWLRAKALGRVPNGVENPADHLHGSLGELLANYKKTAEHRPYPALHFEEIPEFVEDLRNRDSVIAQMIVFGILTALRSKACRYLRWADLDFDRKTISVYQATNKIKDSKLFTTYMSDQVCELLMSLPRVNEYVFPSPATGRPLPSDRATKYMAELHKRKLERDGKGWIDPVMSRVQGEPVMASFHGTARAGFKTWSRTGERRATLVEDAVELCMGHKLDDPYDGAYDRAGLEEERREVLQKWADFCCSRISSNLE